jgi:eukaryotic-like serine/threonine-protein kinase
MAADPISTVNPDALLGQVLDGRYRIDSVLGVGGMGMVFQGVQTSMSRPVALKTLHPELAMAPQFFERFRREAEIASRLHHPNIITMYDFGKTPEGLCYFVMEYLPGESLRQRVRRDGPMSLRQAAGIIEQAALGVGHAHKQQVIHRDLKPHNIMITNVDGHEYVKVLDFGLVKAMEQEEEEQLTSTGQVLGTPQYMPPEQAGGERVDQRSDLYSLTGVFYYCLTGTSPYGANTVRKALQAGINQGLAPIASHRPTAKVPESIEQFCVKGLRAEPDERFQSSEEFVEALQAALTEVNDDALDAMPSGASVPVELELATKAGKAAISSKKSGSLPAIGRPVPKAAQPNSAAPPMKDTVDMRATTPPLSIPKIAAAVAILLAIALGLYAAFRPTPKGPSVQEPVTGIQPVPTGPLEAVPTGKATLTVELRSEPSGADVIEDGVTLGRTPLSVPWPQGTKRTLLFRSTGFRDAERVFRPDANQAFDVALEKAVAAKPKNKASGKPSDNGIGAFE